MAASAGIRGFTLIELMVVIAIIGMMSSVVLASLNSARAKGRDAAIKSAVKQYAVLMELNHSTYGTYAQLQAGWDYTPANCNDSFSGSFAAKAREICVNIVGNNSGAGFHTGNNVSYATHFSVMARLASQATYVCVGGRGGYSDTETGDNWLDAGCFANP